MAKYIYDGPVLFFGRYIGNFHGETTASSEAKARNNLTYQCKKKCNKNANSGGIALPGKISLVS